MFALVVVARELFEVPNEALQAATVMPGHQEVAVVWHHAVGVQEEPVSGAGAGKAIEDRVDDALARE